MSRDTLYKTIQTPPTGLLQRLKEALAIFKCQCGPVFIEESATASEMQPAGSIDIRMPYDCPSVGWQSPNRLEHCESCPRFKAYWQGVAAGKYWERNLGVVSSAEGVKTNVRDGNGETTEIDHVDTKTKVPLADYVHKTNLDAHTDPVIDPIAPGVVNAKHRTKHGNGHCDGLKDVWLGHTVTPLKPNSETQIVVQGGAA